MHGRVTLVARGGTCRGRSARSLLGIFHLGRVVAFEGGQRGVKLLDGVAQAREGGQRRGAVARDLGGRAADEGGPERGLGPRRDGDLDVGHVGLV